MIKELSPLIKKFIVFAKDNLKFKNPPKLFLKQDSENQKCMLGKTAHYDPQNKAITLYISGRHPKDILRSFSHELVHHCQNERGDLAPEKMKTMNKNYAQENDHMRKMEKEAYLMGNMCFRDWEDGLDNKLQFKMQIAEQKFLKENKNMSVKISKKELKGLIEKLLKSKNSKISINEGPMNKLAGRAAASAAAGRAKNKPSIMQKAKTRMQQNKTPTQTIDFEKGMTITAQPPKMPDELSQAIAELEAELAKLGPAVTPQAKQALEKLKASSMATASTAASMDEGGCGKGGRGMRPDPKDDTLEEEKCKKCNDGSCPDCKAKTNIKEESEELEEKLGDGTTQGTDSVEAGLDKNPKFTRADLAAEKGKKRGPSESKIQTPEQENTLYEQRFTPKNNRLFEKLLKEWTK